MLETEVLEDTKKNSIFHIQKHWYTYEFTDMETIHKWPVQVETRQNSSLNKGSGQEVPPCNQEAILIDNC